MQNAKPVNRVEILDVLQFMTRDVLPVSDKLSLICSSFRLLLPPLVFLLRSLLGFSAFLLSLAPGSLYVLLPFLQLVLPRLIGAPLLLLPPLFFQPVGLVLRLHHWPVVLVADPIGNGHELRLRQLHQGGPRQLLLDLGRYRGKEGPPKTASSVRDLDLPPPPVEALKTQKAQQAAERLKAGRGAPEPGQDYVFTGPEGGLLNMNFLRDRVWYPTLAKAGLSRRTMYQTRHTFASNALAAGEAASWVARMLGHASPEMLFSVYARYIPNRTRRDGSALLSRMGEPSEAENGEPASLAVLPKYSR